MYGKYEHAVDPKGRLFVPSKLREELGVDLAKADTLSLLNCLLILKDQQEIDDCY